MSPSVAYIRFLTSVAVAVIACAFTSLYNYVSSFTVLPGAQLPRITEIVILCGRYAYAFPVLLLFVGLPILRKGHGAGIALECLNSSAWIISLLWILTALWAWQLPRIPVF